MSWVIEKAKLVTVLNSNNYNEIPDTLNEDDEISMARSNKGYSILPDPTLDKNVTAGTIIGIKAIVTIYYEAEDVTKRDLAFDSFLSIIDSLASVHSLADDPSFERDSEDYIFHKAIVSFWVLTTKCG